MATISITPEAFEAIGATLPHTGRDGLIRISLDPKVRRRARALRGPGESYSDVILRRSKRRRMISADRPFSSRYQGNGVCELSPRNPTDATMTLRLFRRVRIALACA